MIVFKLTLAVTKEPGLFSNCDTLCLADTIVCVVFSAELIMKVKCILQVQSASSNYLKLVCLMTLAERMHTIITNWLIQNPVNRRQFSH